jgi:hypothetical protein
MGDTRARRDEILETSVELREWAVGLREWSRGVREASVAHRRRSDLARWTGPHLALDLLAERPGLPCMGPVWMSELGAALTTVHGLGAADAARALRRGLLVAGYPLDVDFVAAADAFEIIEHALRHRR